jgi:hypothetical protein
VDSFRNFYFQFIELAPNIAFALLVWGVIDNYFLIRYGGKLNRGFTVWKTPLNDSDRQFLLTLKEDIEEKTKIGLWRTKTSFIMVKDGEILIRYSHPSQNTSWPVVGYVDTTSPDTMLEYRLSVPMLAATIFFASAHIFVVLILSVIFVICWFLETGWLRKYLSQKSELYIVRWTSHIQKVIS